LKKSLAALIILIFIFLAFGCAGPEAKNERKIPTNQAWAMLKSNFESLLQTKEAKDNKKISRFHWNFLTEGIVNSSKRISQSLENDNSREAEILKDAAEKIITLTNMYSEEINKGKAAEDAPSVVQSIREDLDQAEMMIKNSQK